MQIYWNTQVLFIVSKSGMIPCTFGSDTIHNTLQPRVMFGNGICMPENARIKHGHSLDFSAILNRPLQNTKNRSIDHNRESPDSQKGD